MRYVLRIDFYLGTKKQEKLVHSRQVDYSSTIRDTICILITTKDKPIYLFICILCCKIRNTTFRIMCPRRASFSDCFLLSSLQSIPSFVVPRNPLRVCCLSLFSCISGRRVFQLIRQIRKQSGTYSIFERKCVFSKIQLFFIYLTFLFPPC